MENWQLYPEDLLLSVNAAILLLLLDCEVVKTAYTCINKTRFSLCVRQILVGSNPKAHGHESSESVCYGLCQQKEVKEGGPEDLLLHTCKLYCEHKLSVRGVPKFTFRISSLLVLFITRYIKADLVFWEMQSLSIVILCTPASHISKLLLLKLGRMRETDWIINTKYIIWLVIFVKPFTMKIIYMQNNMQKNSNTYLWHWNGAFIIAGDIQQE